jgi:hypothetical protein
LQTTFHIFLFTNTMQPLAIHPYLHPIKKNLPAVFLLLVLFAVLSVTAFRNTDILPDIPYTYDEADYRHAVNQGFFSNYIDRDGLPLSTFIEKGLEAGFNKEEWGRLSQFVRSSNETAFYRHYHGPLYFYWLIFMKHLGATTEKQMRYTTMILLLVCSLLVYFLFIALFPQQSRMVQLSLVILFLFGPSIILTFNHITPHGLYVLFSAAALGCAALFGKTGNRSYWYCSLVAASLAFMTLEYTAFLLLTLVITVWSLRKTHFSPLTSRDKNRFLTISILCFLVPLFILWPGGIIKLTVVKNYLYYAYFTLIRGEYYGQFSVLKVWGIRIMESPVEYAALFSGIAASLIMIRKNRWLVPPVVYGFCILCTGIRNTSTFPQYLTSVFPAFYLVGAAGLFALLEKKTTRTRTMAALCIAAAVAVNCWSFFTFSAPRSWQCMPYQIASLDNLNPIVTGNRVPFFIGRDYIPAFQYYFPDSRLNPFNPLFENDTAVVERVIGHMKKNDTPALLFLDREQPSTFTLINALMTVEKRWVLFLSDQAPNAVCYRLSLKGP